MRGITIVHHYLHAAVWSHLAPLSYWLDITFYGCVNVIQQSAIKWPIVSLVFQVVFQSTTMWMSPLILCLDIIRSAVVHVGAKLCRVIFYNCIYIMVYIMKTNEYLHLEYLWYLHKLAPFVRAILSIIKQTKFYMSSTSLNRVRSFAMVNIQHVDLNC